MTQKNGENMDFQFLGVYDMFCCVILFLSTVFQFWSIDRGAGLKSKRSYKKAGPPDIKSLSAVIGLVSSAMYFAKGMDFLQGGNSEFSLNKIWYLDYCLTCPMLIFDLALTIELKHKLRITVCCWLLLSFGMASFLVSRPYSYGYYGVGLFFFICYFTWIAGLIKARIPDLPDEGRTQLYMALSTFFIFWPMFPTAWIFNWRNLGVLSEQNYFIIHGILDIICKGVYGFTITYYRLIVEDVAIQHTDPHKRQSLSVVSFSQV